MNLYQDSVALTSLQQSNSTNIIAIKGRGNTKKNKKNKKKKILKYFQGAFLPYYIASYADFGHISTELIQRTSTHEDEKEKKKKTLLLASGMSALELQAYLLWKARAIGSRTQSLFESIAWYSK
jgi:hypothetical protein